MLGLIARRSAELFLFHLLTFINQGQKLADFLTTTLLCLAAVGAWLVGFVFQDLGWTVYVGLIGTALTLLVVVPPWPLYNLNPQAWLPVGVMVEKKAS